MNEAHEIRPATVWRHAEGSRYVVMRRVKIHDAKTSSWEDGVLYTRSDLDTSCYVRTIEDFLARFTKVNQA